jgi:hypothetical protein
MNKKLAKALAEKRLAEIMKKQGATGVPNENTYIATAHEQAMAGDKKAAMETMQYSIKNQANDQIMAQEEEQMKSRVKEQDRKKALYNKSK